MLTSSIETSSVSILPEEVIDYNKIKGFYSELVKALENYNKTNDLDSFSGLGYNKEIKMAKEHFLKNPSEMPTIKKQFLAYGDCLRNELDQENVSDEEKVNKLVKCGNGSDFESFMNKIYKEVSKSTTV